MKKMMDSKELKQTFGAFIICLVLSLNILFSTIAFAQQDDKKNNQLSTDEQDKDRVLQTFEEQAVAEAAVVAAQKDEKFLTLGIEAKKLYYVGEIPIIKLILTNTSGGERQILEAKHRQYQIRGKGIFNNGDSEVEVKEFAYQGSFVVFEPLPNTPKSIVLWTVFESPQRSRPTYVTLKTNEATSVEIGLSKIFSTEVFYPGKYKITAKTESGDQEAITEFKIYFDEGKSTPILAQKLRDEGDIIAFHSLRQYNRPKLIVVLEEMLQSKDETMRLKGDELFSLLRQMDKYEINKAKQH